MTPPVTTHIEDRVARITLNRPEKRNALSGEVVDALGRAMEAAGADDAVRCIVLTGAGSAFSSGADLAELGALQDATREENEADSQRLADLFRSIYVHPKPVIARVNGHAIAGGCGLAAVCDIAVAVEDAKCGFTEVRIGFVPAIVGIFVRRKVGEAAARDLLLRGHVIQAEEAARLGLITKAVSRVDLDAEVDGLVRDLTVESSSSAVRMTKRMLGDTVDMDMDEALRYAVELNARARSTDDCRAGIEAFLKKVDPPWKTS
ncbi:MAG: enoyl-CoA hydratase-related protein [Rhodothermales bacterium]